MFPATRGKHKTHEPIHGPDRVCSTTGRIMILESVVSSGIMGPPQSTYEIDQIDLSGR
jgi:hypothetical protein